MATVRSGKNSIVRCVFSFSNFISTHFSSSKASQPVKHAYIHHVSCHNQVGERENDLELISAVGDCKNRLEITNKFHIQQRVFNAKVTAIYEVTLRISMQYGGSNACLT